MYDENYTTFGIEIYDHEHGRTIERLEFKSKREGNKFIKDHTEKRGYDFFYKTNRSIEYNKQY